MFAGNTLKLCSIPGEEHTSYTVYLLYSLCHTITLYCTAVLVESLIFLLRNQKRWRSDVKCLAKARICCLVKRDGISYGVVMDECEEMVK
jgi:hypothetical protein